MTEVTGWSWEPVYSIRDYKCIGAKCFVKYCFAFYVSYTIIFINVTVKTNGFKCYWWLDRLMNWYSWCKFFLYVFVQIQYYCHYLMLDCCKDIWSVSVAKVYAISKQAVFKYSRTLCLSALISLFLSKCWINYVSRWMVCKFLCVVNVFSC